MRLQVSEGVVPVNWDAQICALDGNIFHSTAWAQYKIAAQPNAVPQYITLLSHDDVVIGAALGFYERSRQRLFCGFTGRFRLDSLPVIRADNDAMKMLVQFIRLLENHARAVNAVELALGSFASQGSAGVLEKVAFETARRFEFELGLARSEEDLWNGMEYKRRKDIKKAIRMGVTIHDLSNSEGLRGLRRLQVETRQRILARGGPDTLQEGPHEHDPAERLLDSGYGRIMVAKVEAQVVSAVLFTCFNGLVYGMLCGHGHRAYPVQAPTLLLWETIKRYRLEGARAFSCGGCGVEAINENSAEHGVYLYKKAFGATQLECTSGRKIIRRGVNAVRGTVKTLLGWRRTYQDFASASKG